MAKYKYKDRAFTAVKAQIAGDALDDLFEKNDGVVVPATVVRAAKPKRSPIHNCFEWDNNVAAHKYREVQAGYLLRSIVVVHEQDDEDVEPMLIRAFVSVESEEGRYYTTINRAFSNDEIYDNVEHQAYEDYMALYHKYKNIKLFRKVNKELDKIEL